MFLYLYIEYCIIYIESFNRDARNLLDHSSHVVKVTSVEFVVNCLVMYGKSPWKVIVLSNVMQIIKFYYQNQCSVRETFRALRDFYPRHDRPAELPNDGYMNKQNCRIWDDTNPRDTPVPNAS